MAHLARQSIALVAGGRGSRLGPMTHGRAKPAVPFGGRFRIIDFTRSNCLNSGNRRIGIATQYKARSLISHMHRGGSFLDGRLNEFRLTGTRERPTPCNRTSSSCAVRMPASSASSGATTSPRWIPRK